MAAKLRGDDTVFMTYCGDGGTSSSDFHAVLNFAGVYKAPVVFVAENNQWAISVPFHKQTGSETIAAKGQAYGIPGVRVDGNDVLVVHFDNPAEYGCAQAVTELSGLGRQRTRLRDNVAEFLERQILAQDA